MSLIPQEPNVERIERFVSLQPGRYWRALEAIPSQAIDAGEVLLLESIRWAEDQVHTIVLRAHPSKYNKRVLVTSTREDGSTSTEYVYPKNYRFLVKDFLSAFVFEPDHEKIRSEELQQTQKVINSLQQELLQAQTDPRILAAEVEKELSKASTSDKSALPALMSQHQHMAQTITSCSLADAIGMGVTEHSIAAMKDSAQHHHQVATIKSKWIQSKTAAISDAIQAMTPYYEELSAAALAQTEEVKEHVQKLLEGIASLDLYTGKDVQVFNIQSGASAPASEPLTFVQKKLLMDEELAIWADIDEWFDFSNHELFFDAMRKHPELVDQIFPTPRCMLVMATTRRNIDYGDAFVNDRNDRRNKTVFILVRDGDNLHQVYSPVESHLGSSKLFPSKDDQERIFRGVDGSQIKFEDVTYTYRVDIHKSFALHYKRLLLLACGLDHRLKLFGDFYEGEPSFKFVSMQFQEDYCRFLHDDDGTGMLPKQKRQPLAEWINEKNAYLSSGSRVLCFWDALMNPTTAPSACKPSRFDRGRFDQVFSPRNSLDVVTAYRVADGLYVDIEVSGYSFAKGDNRTFNCRVKLEARYERHHDSHPFLCLDAVSPEEIHWYIHNRDERRDQLRYIRLFKTALRHVEGERVQEAATRQAMADALVAGNIGSPADHPRIIDQTVLAWRADNRGKALPSLDAASDKVRNSLFDQMFMLAGEGQKRVPLVEQYVLAQGLTPLRLVLTGTSKLVVYAAADPFDRDDRLEPHIWVHRITLEMGKRKLLEKGRTWDILPAVSAAETLIHEWDGAASWVGLTSRFASLKEKQEFLELPYDAQTRIERYSQRFSSTEFAMQLEVWSEMHRDMGKGGVPQLVIAFGMVETNHGWQYLCVGTSQTVALLYQLAPDEQAQKQVREEYVKAYVNKPEARRRFDVMVSEPSNQWELMVAPAKLLDNRCLDFVNSEIISIDTLPGQQKPNPLLGVWFEQWHQNKKPEAYLHCANPADFDELLGITLPDVYDPVHVRFFSMSFDKERSQLPVARFNQWYDIVPGATSNEDEFQTLINAHGRNYSSVSSNYRDENVYASHEMAKRAIVQRVASQPHRALKTSTDLPDAPQPPAGVERWYVLAEEG